MTPPMPANNPQPEVKDADQNALEAIDDALGFLMADEREIVLQALARHRIAAERATRERVLEEAARKAEHSCYDYANTIEPSINDDGSKAFGFGFDYACEVIAAAIRALQEPKV